MKVIELQPSGGNSPGGWYTEILAPFLKDKGLLIAAHFNPKEAEWRAKMREGFINKNPNSTIPVLDDNNFIIYESNAIIKYISNKFNILKSNDLQFNALSNQWIDWSSLVFGIPCALFTAHSMLLPKEKRNASVAAEAKNKIYSIFEILNTQLAKHSFILNNELSIADIPIGCWFHRCNILGIDFSNFKEIEKWYVKLRIRKAFQDSVFTAPLPPN